jgi:hypothetical protein
MCFLFALQSYRTVAQRLEGEASALLEFRAETGAASVIHPETLFPSASAASSTLECTSASTVTASFTAGSPLGMRRRATTMPASRRQMWVTSGSKALRSRGV